MEPSNCGIIIDNVYILYASTPSAKAEGVFVSLMLDKVTLRVAEVKRFELGIKNFLL